MASESAATILCTAKQTRFHIEAPNYREVCLCPQSPQPPIHRLMRPRAQLDIQGLSITVTSSDKPAGRKSKARSAQGVEILSEASLRLKQGQRYALVGRNGTGKSSRWEQGVRGAFERPLG